MAPAPAEPTAAGAPVPPTLRHFKWSDFACSHCGENRTKPEFALLIDEVRERCGFPIILTSGYRCPLHNKAVSTTGGDGPHVQGCAADLAADRARAVMLLRVAIQMPFRGYGISQKGSGRFIHLDCVDRPTQTVWSY